MSPFFLPNLDLRSHGLGLGHTDEAMYNSDTGECMDYTIRPENNQHPGRVNFEALEGMYGNVNGSSVREDFVRRRIKTMSMEYIRGRPLNDDRGWRLVHKSPSAEHYERDLRDESLMLRTLLLA